MARLPRLALAGHAHLVLLYGHSTQPVFIGDEDRHLFLTALREAAHARRVAVHAYVLLSNQIHLLLTPSAGPDLGALMQGLGRRYGAAFNRRHQRQGTLWAGRFRATVVQPGAAQLEVMLYIDRDPDLASAAAGGASGGSVPEGAAWSSARHHLGLQRDPLITDNATWWSLGNTPFEREAAYRHLLNEGLSAARAEAMAQACRHGWPLGDAAFLAELAQLTGRPMQARPLGRPPKLRG